MKNAYFWKRMKKILFGLMALAVFACTKENDNEGTGGTGGRILAIEI